MSIIGLSRHNAKVLWPLIKAYSEGMDIQRYSKTFSEWKDEPEPFFDPNFEWRVKPISTKEGAS